MCKICNEKISEHYISTINENNENQNNEINLNINNNIKNNSSFDNTYNYPNLSNRDLLTENNENNENNNALNTQCETNSNFINNNNNNNSKLNNMESEKTPLNFNNKTNFEEMKNKINQNKANIPENIISELENPNLCEICFNKDVTVDIAVKFHCSHIFCLECVKTYLEKNIENGKVRFFYN